MYFFPGLKCLEKFEISGNANSITMHLASNCVIDVLEDIGEIKQVLEDNHGPNHGDVEKYL